MEEKDVINLLLMHKLKIGKFNINNIILELDSLRKDIHRCYQCNNSYKSNESMIYCSNGGNYIREYK